MTRELQRREGAILPAEARRFGDESALSEPVEPDVAVAAEIERATFLWREPRYVTSLHVALPALPATQRFFDGSENHRFTVRKWFMETSRGEVNVMVAQFDIGFGGFYQWEPASPLLLPPGEVLIVEALNRDVFPLAQVTVGMETSDGARWTTIDGLTKRRR